MKWESNGELAQRDLSELVNRLLDVESQTHSNELSRLGMKYEEVEEAMENPNSANRTKYETIRRQNLHKMEPIPVCKIPN